MADGPAAEEAPAGDEPAADGVERLVGHLESYFLVAELVAGWRAGLLQAVLDGPGTAAEVAERAGAHERSTGEWLALLCAAGLVTHADGVFTAAPGLEPALDPERLGFDLTVLLEMTEMWPRLMPALARSLAGGGGIPYSAYQPEFTDHVDRLKRPLYEQYLVADWIASVDGLPERLAGGIDVADVGCGAGQALVLAAAEWPRSRFVGYEVDEVALELCRRRAAERGLDNLRVERRDATRLDLDQAFDLVLALDTVHDLPDPRVALAGINRALRPGGVLVMVEAAATGDLDVDTGRPGALLGYASSVGHCMQVSLASGGRGVGNQWGRDAVLADLGQAGFGKVAPYDSPAGLTVYAASAPATGPDGG
jgi:SAM-dependent methyltransferase